MHVPDGIIEPWIWILLLIVSACVIVFSIYKLSKDEKYDMEKMIPFIGIMAAFIFAAQFVNFPVAPLVSGHLVGGVLVAVLLSPYAGAIVMTLVLLVQMLFGDGGITVIGLNIFNMGVIGCFLGFLIVFGLVKILKGKIDDKSNLLISTGIASYITIVLAALLLGIEISLSSSITQLSPTTNLILIEFLVFWHAIIGIGEVLITCAVLAFIMKAKPELISTNELLELSFE
ncbi:MAG: cobalamin biosynthesis protein [Candidatus Lokiarchaeota archaeon]|nr:cobalamin biosynthesis protein [Candidatus Lokiarchaeota archaeon]